MTTGDQVLATVRRYVSDLEERVDKQKSLIEKLTESGRDSTQARQTLRALTTTLALTREHLEFQALIEAQRKASLSAANR